MATPANDDPPTTPTHARPTTDDGHDHERYDYEISDDSIRRSSCTTTDERYERHYDDYETLDAIRKQQLHGHDELNPA